MDMAWKPERETLERTMARCFYSGVERPLTDCRKLNLPRAYEELRRLRRRLAALETIVERLGEVDVVSGFDGAGQVRERYLFRLVCPEIAETLETVTGCADLFESWDAWQVRRTARLDQARRRADGTQRRRLGRRYKATAPRADVPAAPPPDDEARDAHHGAAPEDEGDFGDDRDADDEVER